MTVDSLSLENIDEFVNDENKIVTVKWLSLTLKVHCNTAKQLLYKFVQNEREVKDNDNITVTYFISGLSKPDSNDEQAFKFAVVPESKLEVYKSTLKVVTSCHIYSVQKTKLKDSSPLYMTDYEKVKEDIFESQKYSSIQYEKAVLRTDDELDMLRVPLTTTKEETGKKPPAATNGVSTAKPAGSKGQQSAIASMFAKADQKKPAKDDKTKDKTEDKTKDKADNKGKKDLKEEKTDKKEIGKVSEKKPGGMMAFFPKQTEKKTEPSTSKPESKSVQKVEEKKTKGATKKTRPLDSDDDDDDSIGRPKRRRIKQDILDSSSEDEAIDVDDEEPIPPTPPRHPSPAPREPTPEPEPKTSLQEEASASKDKIEDKKESGKGDNSKQPSKGGNTEGGRNTTRKLVPKTYMDKDGFMVTENVWESVTTEVEETSEPVAKSSEKAKPKTSPVKGKQKGSPKKKSPQGKKGPGSAGSAKQTSLMSFFKKT